MKNLKLFILFVGIPNLIYSQIWGVSTYFNSLMSTNDRIINSRVNGLKTTGFFGSLASFNDFSVSCQIKNNQFFLSFGLGGYRFGYKVYSYPDKYPKGNLEGNEHGNSPYSVRTSFGVEESLNLHFRKTGLGLIHWISVKPKVSHGLKLGAYLAFDNRGFSPGLGTERAELVVDSVKGIMYQELITNEFKKYNSSNLLFSLGYSFKVKLNEYFTFYGDIGYFQGVFRYASYMVNRKYIEPNASIFESDNEKIINRYSHLSLSLGVSVNINSIMKKPQFQ